MVALHRIGQIKLSCVGLVLDSSQWGALYIFIANFFTTQIIGGAKELVVLL
jgi:hypothetical protein